MRCEPCGFDRPDLSGSELHREHRAQHLAVFPDVDQGTRDNLDLAVEWGAHREAVS